MIKYERTLVVFLSLGTRKMMVFSRNWEVKAADLY